LTTWRALAALAGLAVLAWLVWEIGPGVLLAELERLSWRLPVLLLPYALVAVLDAAGWRYAFPGRLPPLALLVPARLAGEAVNVATPAATLGGEPVKAWLVARTHVPLSEALASVVVAKTALVVSHVLFIALALVLVLDPTRPAPAASPALVNAMIVLAVVGALAIAGFVWAQQRGLFGRSRRVLAWFGVGERVADHLVRLDDQLGAFYRARRARFAAALGFHFLGWIAGTVEVWAALHLLGAPIDFATALVIEAFGSAVRSATFLIPASLGVQEGGLVGIFLALELSAGTGLTFALVRRLREAAWTAAGFAFLVVWRDRRPALERPAG
jgi:putative membrane protein